jgi:hypothetical protein
MFQAAMLEGCPAIAAPGILVALTTSRSICCNATVTIYSFAASMCCATSSAMCNRDIRLKFTVGSCCRNTCIAFYNSADHADFATRWRLIKMGFSKALPKTERLSTVRAHRGERGIWQGRYWEHLIRDDADFQAHMDCVHFNPVKHGLVKRVLDWPFSTFHRLVKQGTYPPDWGGGNQSALGYDD